jgi:hypothetical protein
LYGIAAVVLVVSLAVVGYFGGFFNPHPSPPSNGTAVPPLASPEARLLLASFDSGAALSDYTLKYSADDNGAKSSYVLIKNGSDSYVGVQGAFGSMEGFFGKDNATDIACLTYGGVQKCAMAGNDTKMAEVAASLRILLPTRTAYLNQKDDTRKLISTGAITLVGGMVGEKVGEYDAQKISYTLDYSNLTVQQMVSLGVSPSDESLLAITDQKVSFWMDEKTGLMVKSHATYNNRGTPGFYDTQYSEISTAPPKMPDRPGTLVSTEAFVDFYAKSTSDYAVRAACFAKTGNEREMCIKNIAVGKGSWEDCKLIEDRGTYESCSLIVAQETHNHVICSELPTLSDECYIAVVGETANLDLCKGLRNQSLSSVCAKAAAAGKKRLEEAEAAAEKLRAARNCVDAAGCGVFGNAGQHCAPVNTSGGFANETSPLFACLEGVPCSCIEGHCGFAKNETYYACMSKVEEGMMEEYIRGLIPDNATITKQAVAD